MHTDQSASACREEGEHLKPGSPWTGRQPLCSIRTPHEPAVAASPANPSVRPSGEHTAVGPSATMYACRYLVACVRPAARRIRRLPGERRTHMRTRAGETATMPMARGGGG